jgi:hypothetical protein
MLRDDPGLEFIGFLLTIAGIIAAFVILPAPWYVAGPVAVFAGYAVLETVLPKVWETPPEGIRHDPDE